MILRRTLPDTAPIEARGPYRILSLGGGGYRALFTAQLLARIESMPDYAGTPIGHRFDMIAGTSAGGLIAVALALGEPAEKVVQILIKHGPRIFPPMSLKKMVKLLGRQVYSVAPLEAAIKECVGDWATRPFSNIRKSVMLTTVSWTAGRLVLLRSGALSQLTNPAVCSVLDATCASAAAPAHFPARKMVDDWYIDGGLAANCPDLHALQEVEQLARPVMMLSIGTAGVTRDSSPDLLPRRGITWAKPALDLGIHAQEILAQETCAKLLGNRYLHLNKRPGVDQGALRELDLATPASTTMLAKLADERFRELHADQQQMQSLKQIVSSTICPC
jgi:predicted acylesterase/phospholipase RssA